MYIVSYSYNWADLVLRDNQFVKNLTPLQNNNPFRTPPEPTMAKQSMFYEDLPHPDCLTSRFFVPSVGTHLAIAAADRSGGVADQLLLAQKPIHQFRSHQILRKRVQRVNDLICLPGNKNDYIAEYQVTPSSPLPESLDGKLLIRASSEEISSTSSSRCSQHAALCLKASVLGRSGNNKRMRKSQLRNVVEEEEKRW